MLKESDDKNSVVRSEASHRCGLLCLGPLTFHPQATGNMVRLSQGCRLAERNMRTFRNGLVFTNRPVKIREKIHLRVEKDVHNWQGALRVGFTNVSPSERPLPSMAMPDLTDCTGHWAAPLRDSYCRAGSVMEFWVSGGGNVFFTSNNSKKKLLSGVDISQPLWAMIDIYGQTCSIFLLGSKKKGVLYTRRSCPAHETLTSPDIDNPFTLIPDDSRLQGNRDDCMSCLDVDISADEVCVVCMVRAARITLPCGHQCLCKRCNYKVSKHFGTCPLCRHMIRAPSADG
ncbi:E3 ubiquitin-protein ligase NEURL3 [Brachyistius frenatus]|uniref:E3 ubiquitin-protein ligase NEURL3 n=1 Tax=Brachyistius frenatus TaxID=100188 RepID=UPI0037E82888